MKLTGLPDRRMVLTGLAADWNESDHPRDDIGRFGEGAGNSPASEEAVKQFADKPTIWTSKASGIEYVTNPVAQVDRADMSRVRAQQEALEDAFADGDDSYFEQARINPAELKSLQNQVARNQVVDVASRGSFNSKDNGEAPLVIRGPNGLILIDGNHRASAALVAGQSLEAQVFDYDKWEAAQEAKKTAKQKDNRLDDDALLAELAA